MDAIDQELQSRIFGQSPLPPVTGVPGRDIADTNRMREVMQGDAPGTQPGLTKLPAAQMERMRAMIAQLASFFQNANITAALPAHNEPTWWSQPVDLSGAFSLPAAITPYTTVVSYKCALGTRARVTAYGVNVVDTAYTYNGNILWRLRKNGVNIINLADWGEQRGSLVQPRETFIILEPNDVLEFQVKRVSAVGSPQTVQMCFTGYTWKPRRDYEGYRSSINAQ